MRNAALLAVLDVGCSRPEAAPTRIAISNRASPSCFDEPADDPDVLLWDSRFRLRDYEVRTRSTVRGSFCRTRAWFGRARVRRSSRAFPISCSYVRSADPKMRSAS